MGRFIKNIILSVLFFLVVFATYSQQYMTHKVKRGETIVSIAKNYKVTPFDIYQLNPDAKNGIKVNDILIIPESKIGESQVITEKEFVGYKAHKVKRKETLYSLSKQYDVSQDDIKKHNPFLYSENLKKGQKIKIPVYKTIRKIPEVDNVNTKNYIVKPKEGKWRIAYKFGISVDELEKLNPDLAENLQIGQVIVVPNIPSNEEKTVDDTFNYYKVLPKEGYYRLKVKLGLAQDELEQLNPELKDGGLKAGMILKIPKSSFVNTQNIEKNSLNLIDSIQNFQAKNIVVMLPFKLHTVDVDSLEETKKRIKEDRYMSVSLEFYSGMLLALDSLKNLGISTNLKVFDTKNLQTETLDIVNKYDFSRTDAIIGPLMQANFEKAATALANEKVPLVSPLTKEVQLYDNVFQSRPSSELLSEKIINFIKKDTLVKQVYIVHDSKSLQSMKYIKSKFPYAKVIASKKNKDGKDLNYILIDDFMVNKEDNVNVFSEGKNVVFLETSDSGFVSNVTSILNSLKSDEKQIVLATTDRNAAFEDESISNVYLSNLQFHFPSIRKDFDFSVKNKFVEDFKKKYGYPPSLYAIRGFDVTMDILLRLASFDSLFESVKFDSETTYLENKFLYRKKLFGGYYNTASYVVKYDGLKIMEAK